MALLGNPSARFPNDCVCRLRTVIAAIADRAPRPSIACVRAQAAAGLARCDAHGCAARVRQREEPLPAASVLHLRGPARQPSIALFSVSPSLCLPPFLPSLPSLLSTTRETLSLPPHLHTNTYTNITMSTRSTRKRKNEEEELVELPEDSDAESEEE